VTGSFAPFNFPISENQVLSASNKCNGSIIQTSLTGNQTQIFAWGFHNLKALDFDDAGNLWVLDGGMEDRGVRPVKNGKDALYKVKAGVWYGWPDFSAGEKVEPAILAEEPNTAPKPVATFDLNKIQTLAITPDRFMTNSALAKVSETQIQKLNINNGELSDFAAVASGRITAMKFGPDGNLYILVAQNDKTSKLYKIERVTPNNLIGSTVKKTHPAVTNWILGLMLSGLLAAAFYVSRQLKRTV
jgi:glucose/arabinose dehydrogenase